MSLFRALFIIVLLLYGPKYGYIDCRVFGLFCFNYRGIRFNKRELALLRLPVVLLVYTVIVYFAVNEVNRIMEFLRFVRVILSLLLMIFLFKFTAARVIEKALVIALVLNGFVSLFSLISPLFESIIHELIGFSKSRKFLRTTGLFMGYDINGLLLLLTTYYLGILGLRRFTPLLFVLTLFTSRVTMAIAFLSLMWRIITRSIKEYSLVKRGFILMVSVPLFMLAIRQFKQHVLPTIIGSKSSILVENSYSKTSPQELVEVLIVLPDSIFGWIFGNSTFSGTDSGYIQILFASGLVGLVLTLFYYVKLIFDVYRRPKSFTIVESKVTIISVVCVLILSFKNQYFFTRGIFELVMLFYFLYERGFKNNSISTEVRGIRRIE